MKYTILFLVGLFLFSSCGDGSKNSDTHLYRCKVPVKNGDGTEIELEFWVDNILKDSLNIPPDSLILMCRVAADHANDDCENPSTYKHDPNHISFFIYLPEENLIGVIMKGSFENKEGEIESVETLINFNRSCQITTVNL